MTSAEKIRLCDGIAAAMLTHLEGTGGGADTLMLTHAVRDLANLCADQQRQLNRLVEVHGS
jgi:hypothetical protein